MQTQINTLSWNRALAADDNTKTAAPIKTTQNVAIKSTGSIERSRPCNDQPTMQCLRTPVHHARARLNTTAWAASTGTRIRFFTKSYLPAKTFSISVKCSAAESKAFAAAMSRRVNWPRHLKPSCRHLTERSFHPPYNLTAPPTCNNCHTGPSTEVCALRARLHQCSYLQGKALRDGI